MPKFTLVDLIHKNIEIKKKGGISPKKARMSSAMQQKIYGKLARLKKLFS